MELSYLSRLFLFSELDNSEIENAVAKCHRACYSPGETIHSSKMPLHGIGVILDGRGRIVSGRGDTLLRILKQGDVFGAASVFSIEAGNRTVVIASSKCSILIIPEDVIKDVLITHPKTAIRYISFLSERIDFLNTRISSLTAGDAVAKVAGYLLSLECDCDGNAVADDSFTAIASKLNMGRASLYRTIDRFVTDGYISRDRERLCILDRDSLEDIIFKKDSGNSRQRKAKQ